MPELCYSGVNRTVRTRLGCNLLTNGDKDMMSMV